MAAPGKPQTSDRATRKLYGALQSACIFDEKDLQYIHLVVPPAHILRTRRAMLRTPRVQFLPALSEPPPTVLIENAGNRAMHPASKQVRATPPLFNLKLSFHCAPAAW